MKVKNIFALIVIVMFLSGCAREGVPNYTDLIQTESPSYEEWEGENNTMQVEEETERVSEVELPSSSEELPTPSNDAFVRVQDYIPTTKQDLRYATINNFTGQVIYTFEDAYLRYGTVMKLQQVCAELATYGYGIKIWDAFRPLEAQRALWAVCPNEKYVSHPAKGDRNHCRGLAIDITMYDLQTGEELEMPSGFDEFSALGDRNYKDCSKEAAQNSKLLESVMKKYGFKGYSQEWWHYNDTDSYPIEEQFIPEEPAE